MKVGVLGCYGFIGSNVLRRLLEMDVEVVGIDRHASIPPWRRENIPGSFPAICADLLDWSSIEDHLVAVDLIVFAAGNPVPSSTSFDLLFNEEFRIILNLLDFMVEKNSNARLLFISSGGTVYGRRAHGVLCSEADPLEPVSLYGAMKLVCEKAIGVYGAQYGLKTIILRLANAYGFGQNPKGRQGLICVVLKRLLMDEEINIWGNGLSYRDYVFIEDVNDLVELLVKNEGITGIYNVGFGRGVSTLEIIDLASRISGRKPSLRFLEARSQDLDWNALSIVKATREFGWKPRVPLDVGVRRMHNWMVKLLHELRDSK
jgi:UDP-glucose 4-epimerase